MGGRMGKAKSEHYLTKAEKCKIQENEKKKKNLEYNNKATKRLKQSATEKAKVKSNEKQEVKIQTYQWGRHRKRDRRKH